MNNNNNYNKVTVLLVVLFPRFTAVTSSTLMHRTFKISVLLSNQRLRC